MQNTHEKQTDMEDKLDCDGFLNDADFWSTDVAEKLAAAYEIVEGKLSEGHWKVINFVRDYYKANNNGPSIASVSKNTELHLDDICELFPCGLVCGAYKLAGLPKPSGCGCG